MVLEVRDIHKSFGAKRVLNGLSFTAREGKAFGLLGRNGAGKTTALRIIMSVFPLTAVRCFPTEPWGWTRAVSGICRKKGDCTLKRRS